MNKIELRYWVGKFSILKSRNMLMAATQEITYKQWERNEKRLNKILDLKFAL